jgi:hypothetical protein
MSARDFRWFAAGCRNHVARDEITITKSSFLSCSWHSDAPCVRYQTHAHCTICPIIRSHTPSISLRKNVVRCSRCGLWLCTTLRCRCCEGSELHSQSTGINKRIEVLTDDFNLPCPVIRWLLQLSPLLVQPSCVSCIRPLKHTRRVRH